MTAAVVVAESGVVAGDVAVAGAEFLQEGAFGEAAGTDVVGETGEKKAVWAEGTVEGTEFAEIFLQDSIGFGNRVLALDVGFTFDDYVAEADVGPMTGLVQGFEVADKDTGTLERGHRH